MENFSPFSVGKRGAEVPPFFSTSDDNPHAFKLGGVCYRRGEGLRADFGHVFPGRKGSFLGHFCCKVQDEAFPIRNIFFLK